MTEILTEVYKQLGVIGILIVIIGFLAKMLVSLQKQVSTLQDKRVEEAQQINEKQTERAIEVNRVLSDVGGALKDLNGSIESLERVVLDRRSP